MLCFLLLLIYFGTMLNMQGFNQRPHEYEMEDYEEYEEEASEPDEEELEAPKSTKDEQDFLKLREQLKARFRQKLKKQSAGALGRLSQTQDKRTVTNDRCVISALCFLGWHHVILLCCKTIVSDHVEDGRMAQSSSKSKVPTGKPAKLASDGHEQKKSALSNQHIQNRLGHVKEPTLNRPKSSSNDSRKVFGDVRNGPGRTTGNIGLKGKVPNQSIVTNKPPRSVTNAPSMKKNVLSAKTHSSAQNHHSDQKRLPPGLDRAKTTMKQPMSSSKAEVCLSLYLCIEVIIFLCRYNPNRYVEMDEDDSDMEVGFDVIQKEERRSSKIAKKEDEEQLRLIEEEEERERRMRTKKKLKQS
ncbi:hypothetical protein BHM03_00004108 [Ensete ventricosum]|nr:hypothetical protein BHM03_00004108 [Ensete ventricosum]